MPEWLIESSATVLGLAFLLVGGDVLVRGAVGLSSRLGVAPLIIGLTVVAFGTSAPELAVNLVAAIQNNTELSFGNIIGSNIANIGLIIGLTALLRPLVVQQSLVRREVPIMIGISVLVCVMALEPWFATISGRAELTGHSHWIGRIESGFLLLLFAGFMYYSLRVARASREAMKNLSEAVAHDTTTPMSLPLSIVLLAIGIAAVVGGGQLTVYGASNLAVKMGVSQSVIGLTLVAIGTSLPELATSIMAVMRGQTDIAVGNVVGSNLFNLMFILGPTSIVNPIHVPSGGAMDLAIMLLLAMVLLPLSITQKVIARWEGGLILIIYLSYLTARGLAML